MSATEHGAAAYSQPAMTGDPVVWALSRKAPERPRRVLRRAVIRPSFYTPKVHCFFVRVALVVVDEMFFAHGTCPYRTPDGRRRRFRLDGPVGARRTRDHRRDGDHRARPATDCGTTGTASRGARPGAGRPAEPSDGPGARTGWRTGGGASACGDGSPTRRRGWLCRVGSAARRLASAGAGQNAGWAFDRRSI